MILTLPFDIIEKDLFFRVVIRRQSDNQLIHQHPKQIPVNRPRMSLFRKHLRGEICHRSTETLSYVVVDALLREAEICKSAMSLCIEHHVIWFKIPKNNHIFVQGLYRKNNLTDVLSSILL